MRRIFLGSFFFLSIIIESTFFSYLPFPGFVPNTTLILTICFALYYEEKNGAIIGFTAGLIKDMIIGRVVGISALTFMIVGFLVGYYNRKVFAENITTPLVLTVASTLFHESVALLTVFLMGYPTHPGTSLSRIFLYQTAYNALISVPIYLVINQVLHSRFLKKSY
ncbi:MAG: rod shape-determining protein MreD [Tindallia sp. MSAO_Bac2]|nr:MAG: rod shape-determining protein MreD [Tindallia sp. MSAO_Bac2]